jgi:hypothetical protein
MSPATPPLSIARVHDLVTVAAEIPTPSTPSADDDTPTASGRRLYLNAMTHFFSGFSPTKSTAGADRPSESFLSCP